MYDNRDIRIDLSSLFIKEKRTGQCIYIITKISLGSNLRGPILIEKNLDGEIKIK